MPVKRMADESFEEYKKKQKIMSYLERQKITQKFTPSNAWLNRKLRRSMGLYSKEDVIKYRNRNNKQYTIPVETNDASKEV